MKYFFFTLFALTTLFASAQSGSINGRITDAEEGNNPLLFAKVIIKETGDKVMTDEKGSFIFENLKEGIYTLVCSFTGYETKEIKTEISSQQNSKLTLALGVGSLSLDDLIMVFATSDKKDTSVNN